MDLGKEIAEFWIAAMLVLLPVVLIKLLFSASEITRLLANCDSALTEIKSLAESFVPPRSVYPSSSLAEAEDLADQWRAEKKLKKGE